MPISIANWFPRAKFAEWSIRPRFWNDPYAVRAGLGWIGKNTTLINRNFGSWIFLAALLTTEELDTPSPLRERGSAGRVRADPSFGSSKNPCGNCRACLDACPTGALVAPYQLDARKCISYLTIEHRGEIPEELRKAIGDRLFGCDACQEACPWNRRTPSTAEKAFYPREGMNPVDLAELQNLDEETFRRRFRGTPIWRAKLEGMLRNAAIVASAIITANNNCHPPPSAKRRANRRRTIFPARDATRRASSRR